MSDKIDLLYDLVKSDREEAAEFREETRESHKQTDKRLVLIEAGLAEHMRRTDLLEDLHKDNAIRIDKLEQPIKAISLIKRWIIGIAAIVGAIMSITSFLK